MEVWFEELYKESNKTIGCASTGLNGRAVRVSFPINSYIYLCIVDLLYPESGAVGSCLI